jgi:hypothetical protein
MWAKKEMYRYKTNSSTLKEDVIEDVAKVMAEQDAELFGIISDTYGIATHGWIRMEGKQYRHKTKAPIVHVLCCGDSIARYIVPDVTRDLLGIMLDRQPTNPVAISNYGYYVGIEYEDPKIVFPVLSPCIDPDDMEQTLKNVCRVEKQADT